MPSPLLRPMRIDDLPQVQALDELTFSNPWTSDSFRYELLENPNGHCWVAEQAGQLAGFIVFWLVVDEIHIAVIAVRPNFRGQGIGRQLVVTGLRALIPLGAVSATLEVREGNLAAQNLYRYFGFRQVGARKRYYQDTGEAALLMTVSPLGADYLVWLNAGAENPWQRGNPLSIPGRASR